MTVHAHTVLLLIVLVQACAYAKDLPSVCVCECCRWTGMEKMQCAQPGLTSFEVASCSLCGVDACAKEFSADCPKRGSNVKSYCVNRSSWKQKFVPVLFLLITGYLVVYGLLFRKPKRSGSSTAGTFLQ
eukprot:Plantae.Rhodophyta-Purpureofilum_apyrenoidigerum.ctg35517.p1 GENE.Plantae.Rhodophyta-Purpureofilum_apyrenoidigerum.ctg35517~~Plantae.Rhodophyta-Purpureofilum_apyrenoidigerum.ctg35517.p1  ORF type:complete len:129 (+),score=11.61 Plantae.Rhodophyta-Purpureofilum_apyrenoidigerum.ctg35517:73-459(+)